MKPEKIIKPTQPTVIAQPEASSNNSAEQPKPIVINPNLIPDPNKSVVNSDPMKGPAPPIDDLAVLRNQGVIPIITHAPERGKITEKDKILSEGINWISAGIKAVVVIVLFILILAYVITPIDVQGISMQPTLHTGNIMLVYKWPQTW